MVKLDFPDSTWDIDFTLLTKDQKAWMLRIDQSRAFKKFVIPARKEKARKRRNAPKDKIISNLPDSLSGIEAVTKAMLCAINDKIKHASVLDLAKTIDILGDVKSKALKDSLSLQAANYTPTIITEDKPKDTDKPEQPKIIIQEPITDKPDIQNTDEINQDNTVSVNTEDNIDKAVIEWT